MGLVTCSAKLLVLTFSLIVLALGALALAFGILSMANTFLGDLLADHTSYACLIAGSILMLLASLGCSGACYAKTRRCSLLTITLFTFLVMVVSAASFAIVYKYEDIVDAAARANFTIPDEQTELAKIEQIVYDELKDGFTRAFDRCEPAVYNTTDLNANYCLESVECVDGDASLPDDRTYMYCKADAPDTLVYPAVDDIFEAPEHAIATKGFGWWVSQFCLPPPEPFAAELSLGAAGKNSTAFAACYTSAWWTPAELTAGPAIYDWLPSGDKFNPKAAFCFCSVSAEGSRLWQRVTHYARYLKWFSLGLCIFFFLCFAAELYLVCCRKKDMEKYYANAPNDTHENPALTYLARP